MITLKELNKKTVLPDADYVLEKSEKLFDILDNLTPKFFGKWLFLLIDPKIVFIKDLLNNGLVPEWVDITIYVHSKKVETICLEFPKLQPAKVSNKEAFEFAIKQTKNIISKSAAKLLYQALGSNFEELDKTLKKLDDECVSGEITYKQVQSVISYTKITYASDVLNAFLMGDVYCWKHYQTLVHNIGLEYAYNALYKYAKTLLSEKQKYLTNQDSKNWRVRKINAPLICYTYVLFANSSSYKQLPEIMYSIQHRSLETVERMINNE